eukprot:TRINITY_DN93547_c0_g1_i1.p1 TRINITY_DN93547_c0_g1~~TRINITY_DN93547_c0_g1_i1.p1  ORF type:complete len:283 (+),score=5.25 TRINITY_DN93547_c0_g1_i1:22-870(+)
MAAFGWLSQKFDRVEAALGIEKGQWKVKMSKNVVKIKRVNISSSQTHIDQIHLSQPEKYVQSEVTKKVHPRTESSIGRHRYPLEDVLHFLAGPGQLTNQETLLVLTHSADDDEPLRKQELKSLPSPPGTFKTKGFHTGPFAEMTHGEWASAEHFAYMLSRQLHEMRNDGYKMRGTEPCCIVENCNNAADFSTDYICTAHRGSVTNTLPGLPSNVTKQDIEDLPCYVLQTKKSDEPADAKTAKVEVTSFNHDHTTYWKCSRIRYQRPGKRPPAIYIPNARVKL